MLVHQINTPKKNPKSRLAGSDLGRSLQRLLDTKMGAKADVEFDSILNLTQQHPYEVVFDSVRISVEESEPRLPFVKKQIMKILDNLAPKYNFCSGGRSAIEINANGDYARCLRHADQKNFIGNIFDEGGIKLLDLSTADAECKIPCKKRMCFARNTIRTETREQMESEIETKGILGDYRRNRKNRKSDIFIRWKITETCNYTCSYCTAWKTVNKKLPEMPVDRLLQAAEIFTNQFDNISLRITGGEPAIKRNYVELMNFLHSRLDKFVEIELRTNFSFPEKQKAVFSLDWQDKLLYHIGCHVYDKNFRPWDFVDILSKPTSVDYEVKFVSTTANQKYVDAFTDYFIENGINEKYIVVVRDIRDSAEDASKIPPAIQTMASRGELPDDFFKSDVRQESFMPQEIGA